MKATLKDYLRHGIFLNLYGLFKYLPSPIGDILRYLIVKIFIKHIGKVRIYEAVTFWYPERIKIGERVTLNEWVYLNGYGGLTIGDGVRIGERTSIITSDHSFNRKDIPIYQQEIIGSPVIIEKNVWIGCHVVILKGVRIGEGAIIAAGAVVTKDVAPFTIVAGVPAVKIKDR